MIGLSAAGTGAAVYSATQTPSTPDTPTITTPAQTKATETDQQTAIASVDKESQDAINTAKADIVAKQALLTAKNRTIKTSGLGVASDVLQTGRKSLLGG